jgi:oligopeptide transport system substrate-binding protein
MVAAGRLGCGIAQVRGPVEVSQFDNRRRGGLGNVNGPGLDRRRFLLGSAGALLAASGAPLLPAQSGGVLRRIVASEITSLDPQRPTGQLTAELGPELFTGLTTTDAAGRIAPGCAASWTTSADGLNWTFRLRRGLAWSDGRPLDARDFLFTLRRYLAPATGVAQATRLESIRGARELRAGRQPATALGVQVIDPLTLLIRLEHPDVELPLNLAAAYCVPQHLIDSRGREWAKPDLIVTNGPYRIESWAAGAKDVRLIRNARFHDAASVAIERVEWLTGYDDTTRLRLFRLGQVDIASIEDMGNLALARRELGGMLRSSAECALGAIGLNTTRKPLDRVPLRQALSIALDRAVLATRVRGLGEQPWDAALPPGIPQYPPPLRPEHAGWPMQRRIEAARALVAQAGISGRLKLGAGFPASPTVRKVFLAVAAMWKPIGIDLELLPLDGRAYTAALQRGDYDIFSYAAFAVVPSAANFLDRFVTDSAENVTRHRNAEYDRLIREAERQPTVAKRFALYREAEKILLRDVPFIPTWAGVSNRLVAKRVRGWVDHPGHAHPSRFLALG